MLFRLMALAVVLLSACQRDVYRDPTIEMTTVASVDLERYQGTWYEIARFPNWFQRGCSEVTADYTLRADGRVDVENACRKEGPEGPLTAANGIARAVDPSNARLKVKFVQWLPFEGDYWILYLDGDYQTAVVGNPAGTSGWILSREPWLGPRRFERALNALERNGYDITRLHFDMPQPVAAGP